MTSGILKVRAPKVSSPFNVNFLYMKLFIPESTFMKHTSSTIFTKIISVLIRKLIHDTFFEWISSFELRCLQKLSTVPHLELHIISQLQPAD